jgi:prolyl-tRNA synthetase
MSKKLPDIVSQFPEWYQDVVYSAELADHSPVKGCMVIMPYGYSIWEHIKTILDKKIKDTGHKNASFPLFIPMSFLEKEAQHVEGFAPELAIVTHAGGKKLEEPLVVRPTSETIIHFMFAKWLKSWRDLPIKINQWANVVRWEMRTRPFLRTTEFFWQEGHTAHETFEEAHKEVLTMLYEYKDLLENYLAIPALAGIKSPTETFAGADKTYTVEGLMQDGKALQMGTSHLISQGFAKSFNMMFQGRNGEMQYPYLTSWGATTRLIGALVMTHGDQKGLVIPPRVAPVQVVIVPIFKKDFDSALLQEAAHKLRTSLETLNIRVEVDADEHTSPGAKFYAWELKGIPLRVELGPRDMESQSVVVTDRLDSQKESVSWADFVTYVPKKLESIQSAMFERALARRDSQWYQGDKLSDFGKELEEKSGFWQTGWCQSTECEKVLKEYKATMRCLIEEHKHAECFNCSQPSKQDVIVAKAY